MSSSVCVVVGAGPGLGRAAALKFAKEGFKVALLTRNQASAKAAEKDIKAAGGTSMFVSCDVTKDFSVKQAFQTVRNAYGDPNVLVFNASAGMGSGGILKEVLPKMIENKEGTILITSATAAFRGSARSPSFPVAMFGLRALAQSASKEHAKDGIHVAHIRIDGVLDGEKAKGWMGDNYDPSKLINTDELAETYFMLHKQPRSAWTNELDVRPFTEDWTY